MVCHAQGISPADDGDKQMRYRLVQQVFFLYSAGARGCAFLGLHRAPLLCGDEWPAVFGDAVDGVEQFTHGGDERELWRFSGGAQSQVEGTEPWIKTDGAEHWHPERAAQSSMPEVADAGPGALLLSGLSQCRYDADESGKGTGAFEMGGIAGGGDDACCGLWPDAIDAGDQLACDMGIEQVLDVVLDLGEALAPSVEVLADMSGLQLIGGSMMLTDRMLGGLDQGMCQVGSDEVSSIIAQPGDAAGCGAGKGMRGGVFGEEAGGEHAVEAANVAGELGKAEIDQTMELANAIIEILAQPVTVADQLPQGLGDFVVQMGGGGSLFEGEACKARGIKGIGLGAREVGFLEAAGDQRVEQRHVVAGCGQHDKEIFPVMAGRLHDDEDRRPAECREQGIIACAILGDGDGLANRGPRVIKTGEDVAFGCDINPCEHDPSCCNRQRLEASAPAFKLVLVKARMQAGKAAPQDTVRARNAGRGRQSHLRGPTPKRVTATLSQLPTRNLSREARR